MTTPATNLAAYRQANPRQANPGGWGWVAITLGVAAVGAVVLRGALRRGTKRPANCPPKNLPVLYGWGRDSDHKNALTMQQVLALKPGDRATAIIQPLTPNTLKYPAYTLPVEIWRTSYGELTFDHQCTWSAAGDPHGTVGAPNFEGGYKLGWMQGYLFDPAAVPPGKQFYLQPDI